MRVVGGGPIEVIDERAELQVLERGGGGTAAELVDLIRDLEELRNVVAAVQLTAIVRFVEQQTVEDLAAGVQEDRPGSASPRRWPLLAASHRAEGCAT